MRKVKTSEREEVYSLSVMFIGGKAAVTNVGNAVDRIFKISGLYKIIEKYDTIQEALYENRI